MFLFLLSPLAIEIDTALDSCLSKCFILDDCVCPISMFKTIRCSE